MLRKIRPYVVRLQGWVARNQGKLKLIDVFAALATKFGEAIKDLPFGDTVYAAVKKVVEFAGNRDAVTKLINKIVDIIDKLSTGEGLLDLIWEAIDASGLTDTINSKMNGRLLAARTEHARRMAEIEANPSVHDMPLLEARGRMLRAYPQVADSHRRLLALDRENQARSLRGLPPITDMYGDDTEGMLMAEPGQQLQAIDSHGRALQGFNMSAVSNSSFWKQGKQSRLKSLLMGVAAFGFKKLKALLMNAIEGIGGNVTAWITDLPGQLKKLFKNTLTALSTRLQNGLGDNVKVIVEIDDKVQWIAGKLWGDTAFNINAETRLCCFDRTAHIEGPIRSRRKVFPLPFIP